MDVRVSMPRLEAEHLVSLEPGESSATVAERIHAAWRVALARNGGLPNAGLTGTALLRACALDEQARRCIGELSAGLSLTARGVHRVLRVARTVADLQGSPSVREEELLAAASLRDQRLEAAASS